MIHDGIGMGIKAPAFHDQAAGRARQIRGLKAGFRYRAVIHRIWLEVGLRPVEELLERPRGQRWKLADFISEAAGNGFQKLFQPDPRVMTRLLARAYNLDRRSV